MYANYSTDVLPLAIDLSLSLPILPTDLSRALLTAPEASKPRFSN